MRWKGRRQSTNVEDRRSSTGRRVAVGGGLGTLVILVIVTLLGGDPGMLVQSAPGPARAAEPSAGEEELRAMVAWSPLLMAMVAAAMLPRPLLRPIGLLGVLTTTPVAQLELRLFVIGLCLLAGLVMLIAALVRPDRSVQDRLAGTWLVPR
jgi:hypothetical protein